MAGMRLFVLERRKQHVSGRKFAQKAHSGRGLQVSLRYTRQTRQETKDLHSCFENASNERTSHQQDSIADMMTESIPHICQHSQVYHLSVCVFMRADRQHHVRSCKLNGHMFSAPQANNEETPRRVPTYSWPVQLKEGTSAFRGTARHCTDVQGLNTIVYQ